MTEKRRANGESSFDNTTITAHDHKITTSAGILCATGWDCISNSGMVAGAEGNSGDLSIIDHDADKASASEIHYLEPARLNLTRSLGGLEPGHINDDGQYNIFGNSSFETLASASDPFVFMSPTRGRTRTFGSETGAPEMSLREARDESECSLGDISPIQLPPCSSPRESENWIGGGFHSPQLTSTLVSNPFYVIRSARKAFQGCKYVLSVIRDIGLQVCQVNISYLGHIRHFQPDANHSSSDWKLAIRRVETAIIAFGGRAVPPTLEDPRSTILRIEHNMIDRGEYQRRLPYRYHLNSSFVSWDTEEDPPITVYTSPKGLARSRQSNRVQTGDSGGQDQLAGNSECLTQEAQEEITKLKYRCKLCGQLKQNHDCPYRQCLHRSIGVMVYPAANSFTAAEPGSIAPPLTKMNNFVSYDPDHGSPKPDLSQGCILTQCSQTASTRQSFLPPTQISPESRMAMTSFFNSPQSSLSNPSDEAMAGIDTYFGGLKRSRSGRQLSTAASGPTRPSVFVSSVTLRPEQYRAISPLENETTAYQYPPIPLTFAERKRLSDTLFHLSSEIPHFAADVASLLHVARQHNDWDQAVAELLTQVVVAMYCSEGDLTLEGLRQYLLGLGIAC